jgi:hypothetical protein
MNPRATAADRATRRDTTGKNGCPPHPTRQRPPKGRGGPGHCVSADTQNVRSRTMRHLRACIALLIALLVASVAHAVTHGLTAGLVVGLALTTLLLLASLALWRVDSRRKHDGTAPPRFER